MAIPIGILMSSYRVVGAALEPTIDFIRYLPVPALVPLTIIWFGVGENTKIFFSVNGSMTSSFASSPKTMCHPIDSMRYQPLPKTAFLPTCTYSPSFR